jgi:hypothetical protein
MTRELVLSTATLILTLDLIGTFVFALSGAASGVKNKLDAFGVGVLAFVAGNAGGVTRDLLIGAVPPAAITDWRYVAVSLAAGTVTFAWYPNVKRLQPIVLLLDAAGLGLFAVAGTQKALAFGINPFVSALLGMLTGIGGRRPRPACERDSGRATNRSVCARRARRCCRRRWRELRALAAHGNDDRRRDPVFHDTTARDPARMESATSSAATLLVMTLITRHDH